MPYCPNCKREFEDAAECPDDKVALVDELPFQTIEGPTSAWVEIASAATEDEADILRGFLEAEGIPCQIESLKFHMLEPVGEIRIYVAAENQQAAMELLEKREDAYDAMPAGEAVMTDEGPAQIADDAQAVTEGENEATES